MTTAHYTDESVRLYHGDCIEVMRQLPDASVDAVVTDPPYGLEFMGKAWDSFSDDPVSKSWDTKGRTMTDAPAEVGKPKTHIKDNPRCRLCGRVINGRDTAKGFKVCHCEQPDIYAPSTSSRKFQAWSEEWATEALRVLKPGGHLLAFGGTRTWHRLACAIEDAGFEVRDSIAWMYGSGFPKSLDVSKAMDKRRDDRDDVLRVTGEIARLRDAAGLTNRRLDEMFGFAGMAGHWTSTKSQPTVPTVEQWGVIRAPLNAPEWMDAEVWRLNGRKGTPGEAWEQREVIKEDKRQRGGTSWEAASGMLAAGEQDFSITAPATPLAQQWQGWGTALKPAFEPIVVARKPLIGTVAANVERYGTGALNIDGGRVGTGADKGVWPVPDRRHQDVAYTLQPTETDTTQGRWPANVILDESQARELDRQSGVLTSGKMMPTHTTAGTSGWPTAYGTDAPGGFTTMETYGDTGGASRFFYTAKASSAERPKDGDVAHPTVKPLDLMRYLVRLVTPPGGTVLEPFAGSGTTLEACIVEGFRCIGIEREADYLPLIMARITKPIEVTLL